MNALLQLLFTHSHYFLIIDVFTINEETKRSSYCVIVPNLTCFFAVNVPSPVKQNVVYNSYDFLYSGCVLPFRDNKIPVEVKLLDPTHVEVTIPIDNGPFFHAYRLLETSHNFPEGSKISHNTFRSLIEKQPRMMKYKVLVVISTGEELDAEIFSGEKDAKIAHTSASILAPKATVSNTEVSATSIQMYYSIGVKNEITRYRNKEVDNALAAGIANMQINVNPMETETGT